MNCNYCDRPLYLLRQECRHIVAVCPAGCPPAFKKLYEGNLTDEGQSFQRFWSWYVVVEGLSASLGLEADS